MLLSEAFRTPGFFFGCYILIRRVDGMEDKKKNRIKIAVFLMLGCILAKGAVWLTAEREKSPEEEMDWFTLEEELRPCILQIICGGYTGSGVVWEITEDKVVVASSGHLLKNAEVCDVICYAGIYYEAEVEKVLGDCDIGFATFPAKELVKDGIELRAVVPLSRKKEELIQGEELAVYGSMDYAAGNFVRGYLVEAEREMQLDGYGSTRALLLGGIPGGDMQDGDSGENDGADAETQERERGAIDAGMSGSGVFDRQGQLVGILAGGDGRYGFAAVPAWRIAP